MQQGLSWRARPPLRPRSSRPPPWQLWGCAGTQLWQKPIRKGWLFLLAANWLWMFPAISAALQAAKRRGANASLHKGQFGNPCLSLVSELLRNTRQPTPDQEGDQQQSPSWISLCHPDEADSSSGLWGKFAYASDGKSLYRRGWRVIHDAPTAFPPTPSAASMGTYVSSI
jgi:hypothetical protein